jgi:ParB family chromosome partitioning protein
VADSFAGVWHHSSGFEMAEELSRAPDHRPRLGRGLAALLGDGVNEQLSNSKLGGARSVPIEFLRPNPRNPRRSFADEDIEELTASIRERGVIQPVLVRAIAGVSDAYEIIAGERRWRAAQRAGRHEIPILLMDVSDRESLELAIIENVQRTDLNPLEEASGYEQLASDHGYGPTEIAKIVGKSRSHISNTMRLAKLPTHSRDLVASGAISAGHARALLAVDDPDATADRIVKHGMTVRDVEKLSAKLVRSVKTETTASRGVTLRNADTRAIEERIGMIIGTEVKISQSGEQGAIKISFHSLDQFDDICRRLTTPI